jgi:hypothetical protein
VPLCFGNSADHAGSLAQGVSGPQPAGLSRAQLIHWRAEDAQLWSERRARTQQGVRGSLRAGDDAGDMPRQPKRKRDIGPAAQRLVQAKQRGPSGQTRRQHPRREASGTVDLNQLRFTLRNHCSEPQSGISAAWTEQDHVCNGFGGAQGIGASFNSRAFEVGPQCSHFRKRDPVGRSCRATNRTPS